MASWALFNKEEAAALSQGETVKFGSQVYRMCDRCKQPVRINKWLIGGMHSCTGGRSD